MDSSPGFGSTDCNSDALFRLAFATAPGLKPLTLLQPLTRRSVLQKVRRQASARPPTACRHTVSGSISLPSRGAFHLSLTVLVHYRSPGVFSLGVWSPQLPTGFHVSRGTQGPSRVRLLFRLQGCHLLWRRFPADSTRTKSSCGVHARSAAALQPHPCNACTLEHRTGLGCSPFARRYLGNLGDFFSSGY